VIERATSAIAAQAAQAIGPAIVEIAPQTGEIGVVVVSERARRIVAAATRPIARGRVEAIAPPRQIGREAEAREAEVAAAVSTFLRAGPRPWHLPAAGRASPARAAEGCVVAEAASVAVVVVAASAVAGAGVDAAAAVGAPTSR
jgi:hypothetical protein